LEGIGKAPEIGHCFTKLGINSEDWQDLVGRRRRLDLRFLMKELI
jgi:hypothetical protein